MAPQISIQKKSPKTSQRMKVQTVTVATIATVSSGHKLQRVQMNRFRKELNIPFHQRAQNYFSDSELYNEHDSLSVVYDSFTKQMLDKMTDDSPQSEFQKQFKEGDYFNMGDREGLKKIGTQIINNNGEVPLHDQIHQKLQGQTSKLFRLGRDGANNPETPWEWMLATSSTIGDVSKEKWMNQIEDDEFPREYQITMLLRLSQGELEQLCRTVGNRLQQEDVDVINKALKKVDEITFFTKVVLQSEVRKAKRSKDCKKEHKRWMDEMVKVKSEYGGVNMLKLQIIEQLMVLNRALELQYETDIVYEEDSEMNDVSEAELQKQLQFQVNKLCFDLQLQKELGYSYIPPPPPGSAPSSDAESSDQDSDTDDASVISDTYSTASDEIEIIAKGDTQTEKPTAGWNLNGAWRQEHYDYEWCAIFSQIFGQLLVWILYVTNPAGILDFYGINNVFYGIIIAFFAAIIFQMIGPILLKLYKVLSIEEE